jgi:hypothetical protein
MPHLLQSAFMQRMEQAGDIPAAEGLPAIRRNGDGSYTVTSPDGTVIGENMTGSDAVAEIERAQSRQRS